MSSEDVERKTKKKLKKEKSSKSTIESKPQEQDDSISLDVKTESKPIKQKKRKREHGTASEIEPDVVRMDDSPEPKKRRALAEGEEELEININLPEPPSKKALRKAKKNKTNPTTSATEPTDDMEDLLPTAQPDNVDPKNAKRSAYGVWIGNLPFTVTKPMLNTFFTSNNMQASDITRIHLPAPQNAKATRTQLKPNNKGFAYVDLANEAAFYAALALSESHLGGRNLLIKDSKSFEGRPAKETDETKTTKPKAQKQASKRIFVGNLGFEVTVEDLTKQLEPCGPINNVHMATFQDTGACKGYAWVTFENVTSAEAAVRGWVRIEEKNEEKNEESSASESDDSDVKDNKKKSKKTRKWFVNRMLGRELRFEFAEDASIRYKKRFGKEAPDTRVGEVTNTEDNDATIHEAVPESSIAEANKTIPPSKNGMSPGAPTDPSKRRNHVRDPSIANRIISRMVKSNDITNKQAEAARYRTGAISQSLGSKIVFG